VQRPDHCRRQFRRRQCRNVAIEPRQQTRFRSPALGRCGAILPRGLTAAITTFGKPRFSASLGAIDRFVRRKSRRAGRHPRRSPQAQRGRSYNGCGASLHDRRRSWSVMICMLAISMSPALVQPPSFAPVPLSLSNRTRARRPSPDGYAEPQSRLARTRSANRRLAASTFGSADRKDPMSLPVVCKCHLIHANERQFDPTISTCFQRPLRTSSLQIASIAVRNCCKQGPCSEIVVRNNLF
jgi:hypothetical protein